MCLKTEQSESGDQQPSLLADEFQANDSPYLQIQGTQYLQKDTQGRPLYTIYPPIPAHIQKKMERIRISFQMDRPKLDRLS